MQIAGPKVNPNHNFSLGFFREVDMEPLCLFSMSDLNALQFVQGWSVLVQLLLSFSSAFCYTSGKKNPAVHFPNDGGKTNRS